MNDAPQTILYIDLVIGACLFVLGVLFFLLGYSNNKSRADARFKKQQIRNDK